MEESTERIVGIKWPDSVADVPTHYANMLFVTHAGPEFFLVFGEVIPPPPGASVPDVLAVKPLVKIAVTHESMLGFAQVINDNIEKFVRKTDISQLGREEED